MKKLYYKIYKNSKDDFEQLKKKLGELIKI
jgi:hypothetical protein